MFDQPIPFPNEVQGVEYRLVPGWPGYCVGDDGSVWSRWVPGAHYIGNVWRKLKTPPNKRGYLGLTLCANGKKRTKQVHQLVLLAFVGPRPENMQGCHGNGIKSDCRLSNLRYDTPKANQADSIRHGTVARGERQGHSQLTEIEVIEILEMLCNTSAPEVAKTKGVSEGAVKQILSGNSWKHIPRPAALANRPQRASGEKASGAKLTAENVCKAKEMHASGKYSFRAIGRILGAGHQTIAAAIRGESWKELAGNLSGSTVQSASA
jgi:hypothetical protein